MNDAISRPSPKGSSAFNAGHALYRAAWRLAGPLLPLYLRRRARRGKEDPARMAERYGMASLARPDGDLLWVHGASVGESLSALPLIERLLEQDPNLHVLVTTGTVTSAGLLEARLPERAFHQYLPLDHPTHAAAFVNHWQPDAVFWIESEFWPNLLREISTRGIPAALLNARLSERSFKRWQMSPQFIRNLIGTFSLCLAQDENIAGMLEALGATKVSTAGNLKFAALPLPDAEPERRSLETLLGERKIIVAAQTVEGEETSLGSILPDLKEEFSDLLLIVVPKHTHRSSSIEQALAVAELKIAVRSRGEVPVTDTDIYLADTMGELGLFFRLNAPVFLGRSLVPGYGGSNLLEPARFGRCIIQGVHTENFSTMNDLFRSSSASLVAGDEAQLKDLLLDVLRDPQRADEIGTKAEAVTSSASTVLDRVADLVSPLLPGPSPSSGEPDARS